MRRPLVLLLLVLVLPACPKREDGARPRAAGSLVITAPDGGPEDGGMGIPRVTGPERMIDERYYVVEGAPHPLACTTDRECIGDNVTDETGCCVRSADTHPQTWEWHAWVTQRRLSQDCDKVTCAPIPVTAMPKICRLDVFCRAGQCADRCEEESPPPPDAGPQEK